MTTPCVQVSNIAELKADMKNVIKTMDEMKADVKNMPDEIIRKLTEYSDKQYLTKVEHSSYATKVNLLFGLFSAVITAAAVAFFVTR